MNNQSKELNSPKPDSQKIVADAIFWSIITVTALWLGYSFVVELLARMAAK